MGGSPPLRWVGSRPLLRHHPLITSFQATINYPSVSIIVTILTASPTIIHSLTTCISLRSNTSRSKAASSQRKDTLEERWFANCDPPLALERTDIIEIITFERWIKICIQIILYHCRFRDFCCSIMVGSVLGRNLKDRPVFGRKKVEECQCRSKAGWRCYGRGKIAPPTSSKAGFVRPMRSACPTTSDTPPATPFSEDFFQPPRPRCH